MDITLPHHPDSARCAGTAACDMTRETLALSELELHERLTSFETDALVLMALVKEGIEVNHQAYRRELRLTAANARLRERCKDQEDQIRNLLAVDA